MIKLGTKLKHRKTEIESQTFKAEELSSNLIIRESYVEYLDLRKLTSSSLLECAVSRSKKPQVTSITTKRRPVRKNIMSIIPDSKTDPLIANRIAEIKKIYGQNKNVLSRKYLQKIYRNQKIIYNKKPMFVREKKALLIAHHNSAPASSTNTKTVNNDINTNENLLNSSNDSFNSGIDQFGVKILNIPINREKVEANTPKFIDAETNTTSKAFVSRHTNTETINSTHNQHLPHSCKHTTQSLQYVTSSDLICLDWINKYLFTVELDPYNVVMDEKIKDMSEFANPSIKSEDCFLYGM